jgi:hypothetical protein
VWELLTMPGTERDIAFSQLAVKGLNLGGKSKSVTIATFYEKSLREKNNTGYKYL